MKKSRLITIVVAIIFSTLPIHAAEPTKTSYAGIAKKKALHQFNESLARIKRCFKEKCTKREALLAARDLGIAATIVITGLYGLGSAIETGAKTLAIKTAGHPYHKTIQKVTFPFARAGEYMQTPGVMAMKPLVKALDYRKQRLYPFQIGDIVEYKGKQAIVRDYHPLAHIVEIQQTGTTTHVIVPDTEVTLEKTP